MDRFGCFSASSLASFDLPAWLGLEEELRLASSSLATATLVVLLVCATREGFAQSGVAGGALSPGTQTVELAKERGVDAAIVPTDGSGSLIRRARELDALLAVRSGGAGAITPAQTDAAIAAAVSRGLESELQKKSGFRKRNSDLFRARRAVELGNQDMEVRLRLRAKARNAMAVELRF